MPFTDEEMRLLAEALGVATEDAMHFGEYGGDIDHVPQYEALTEKIETMLKASHAN